MRRLFLAMTNFRTHTTLFPTHFTAAFSGPFRSHLSNLLNVVDLLICDCFAESQILNDLARVKHPKNIRIGTDGSNCQTNFSAIASLVEKTDYKTRQNLFTASADGSNRGQFS